MKRLCPDCQIIGPRNAWPCNVAYHRDLVAIPRFPEAKCLFETDRYSRGMA